MPRAIWRRRRTTDSPRPAGRRWAGLRRSGSLARQVLVGGRVLVGRVGGRQHDGATTVVASVAVADQVDFVGGDRSHLLPRRRSPEYPFRELGASAPVEVVPQPMPSLVELAPQPAAIGAAPVALLPGERTPIRRLKFAVANGCTVASLLLGMAAVFAAIHSDLRLAALLLLACVIFDGCDGGLARKFGVASPFGAQMDSLADLSSFGVATAIVIYQWLVEGGASPTAAASACALVVVCAAIRLARFNVSPSDGRFFRGIPTTMTAAVLAAAVVVGPAVPVSARVVAVAVFAAAMVSSFPYAKLARVLRLPPWLLVLPVIGALLNLPVAFAAVVLGYLASGPLLWLRQRGSLTRARPAA